MSKRLLLAGTICIAALVAGCLFVILPVYGQQGDTQVSVPSLDVLILVDESGTMWNYTDPEGKRVQAVNLFIDQLSLLTPPGDSHRVGIIAFGTEPKVISGTLDSREDANRIKQEYQAAHKAFSEQPGSKYTDINKALAKALEIMKAEHDPTRKPALILISDGQPFLPSDLEKQGKPAVEAYLQEAQKLIDEFRAVSYSGSLCPTSNGMPLFMLAVGTDVLPEEGASTPEFVDLYKGFWRGMSDSTGGYYEEIEPFDEIGSAVTEVFARLLCGAIYPLGEKFENAQGFQFTVEEEYGQILFVISGKDNPAITSKVFRPGQENPIQPDDKVVKWIGSTDYEIWSVERSEPWAGTWRVALEGEGTAYFYYINYVHFSPFSIEVQQPSRGDVLPVGKPIEIRARVVQKGEKPTVVPAQDFKVSVTNPDGTVGEQFDLEEWAGVYVGRLEDIAQKGEYELTLHAVLQEGMIVCEFTKVTLSPGPWLEYVKPAQGSTFESNIPIPLEAGVHLVGGVFSQDIEVNAELLRDGKTADKTSMDCEEAEGSNVLRCEGQFQAGHEPGAYLVDMTLESKLPLRGLVYDRSVIAIAIVPPTVTQIPTPSPVPPTPTAIETPTTIPTPLPTATPTNTPTPLPTPIPTATPTLPEALVAAALSNYFQCLLCLLVTLALLALILWGLWKGRKRKPRPKPKPKGGKFLQQFREFIAFLGSLWGILTGISVFFPLSNALAQIIPLGLFEQGSGGLVHFSPQLVTGVTMVTALFIILWTYSYRKQFEIKKNKPLLQRQAFLSYVFGLLALVIYLAINCLVIAGYYSRLGWEDDSPLLLLGDVILMFFYSAFFTLVTRAFMVLGMIEYFGEN